MSGDMSVNPYILHGFGPSPYSVKMRAILRYRRLPFVWKAVGWPRDVAVAAGLPPVIPALTFPDGTVMNDSTPLAYALERAHPGQRSIIPDDPAHAWLSDLLEDFGDEWVTKIMFHYRWFYAADRAFAQDWVITSRDPQMPEAERREAMQAFNDRQVGRMAMVGCTDANRPVIEDSYRFILGTLDRHVRRMEYLFGSRPSLADFGLFGQLQILSVDPTPMMEMRERAPDVYCWLLRLDDASGVEGEWLAADAPLPEAVTALMKHCGETYLPFLAANRTALEGGAPLVDLDILGRPWSQAPFRYQAKCYDALRKKLAALPAEVRRRLDPMLDATGCLRWLE
jgi:glutathione S-transferase